MVLSDKIYNRLKWVALFLLPALATLWLALGKIWNLPYTAEIGATISAVDLFLATVLGISNKNYKGDGEMVVNTEDPEKDIYTLKLNSNVAELGDKKSVTFVVTNEGK